MDLIDHNAYKKWFEFVKTQIHSKQIKSAIAVNQNLISLYWDLGKMIVEKQEATNWGNAVVEKLTMDLKNEFPGISGFSRTSLFAMRQFYLFYRKVDEKVPQAVGQIPWGHNRLILGKIENKN